MSGSRTSTRPVSPPPAALQSQRCDHATLQSQCCDHAVLYERLFAVEARLKEQGSELEQTKSQLLQMRTEHQKLVDAVAGIDENVRHGIITRDNMELINQSQRGVIMPTITGNTLSALDPRYALVTEATFGSSGESNLFTSRIIMDTNKVGALPGFFDKLVRVLSNNTTLRTLKIFGGTLPLPVAHALETTHLQTLILDTCTIGDDVAVALSEAVQKNLGFKALDLSKSKLTLIGRAALSVPRVLLPSS
ncbi:hypothetical protein DFS34DRAFT_645772 [Phlyctochytrium arcticum]|nr:hypothetical protein DFS34DRAFT_645772 [Phlyctochytrium arcticum]